MKNKNPSRSRALSFRSFRRKSASAENEQQHDAFDKIETTHVAEQGNEIHEQGTWTWAWTWWLFSRLITMFVPDIYFEWRRVEESKRQAWREKWTLCFIMFLFSAAFICIGGLLPLILGCQKQNSCQSSKHNGQKVSCDISYCFILKSLMNCFMGILSAVLIVQVALSLVYVCRRRRTIDREQTRSKVIVMVPCYNEGAKELKKTIDSVMDTSYPDANKVLIVVADGNITGKGETSSTPETLRELLGFKMTPKDKSYECESLGKNRAKLYYGTKTDCNKSLKYLVIVKSGLETEQGSARAGNRGKRDSQLLLIGLLNRVHHRRKLNALDKAIVAVLKKLSVAIDTVKYLMTIDADTRVEAESISHMTYTMNKDKKILALCGETRIDNKGKSWITWIQVFEYYTNHHMKKAFESVLGCVTCLPGCFTMYRLFTDDNIRLLSCDEVYTCYAKNKVETLHEKNLFHLGEDRMLTTLLLRSFPNMKLTFVPEAICFTIVPETFAVLLSQRRRWINSTFHNMLELLRGTKLPTCCCVSMKFLVVLDLISTLILPVSLIFLIVTAIMAIVFKQGTSITLLITFGIAIGAQVLPFVLRGRLDYLAWFVAFMLLGLPVFYFILPLYSFWHMDDFTWGATRQVDNAVPANTATVDELDDVDVDESNDGVDEEVGAEQHHLAPRSGTHQLSTMAAPARWEFGTGNRQVRVGQDVDVDESNDGVDEEVGAEQHHLAPRSGTHQLSTMAAPARWEFGAGNRQVRVGQDDRRFRSSYVNSSLSHVNEAQLDKELRSLDEE